MSLYHHQGSTRPERQGPLLARSLILQTLCWLILLSVRLQAVSFSPMESAPPDQIEVGAPPFTIFNSDSLGLQTPPFDLCEMPDGRILLVGANELVIGDGVRWELITKSHTESGFISGQVCVDSEGRIWSSRTEGFCRIEFTAEGKWHFGTPIPIPDHEKRQWPAYVRCRRVNSQDYWYSNGLVTWTPDSRTPPRVIVPQLSIDHIFQLGSQLYATNPNSGAIQRVLPDGSMQSVFNADYNDPGASIVCSAPLDGSRIIVGTVLKGVCIFDGKKLIPLFQTGPLAGGLRISDICRTRSGHYAAAVDGQGIVFFTKEGLITQTLNRDIDNRLSLVKRMFKRADGTLWALFSRGLIHLEYPSRISHLDPILGAGSDFVTPIRHQGQLWLLATGTPMRGVYENKRLVKFVKDAPPVSFVYTLQSVEGILIACATEGIYCRTDTGWVCCDATRRNARITARPEGSVQWLYVAQHEVGWMDLSSGTPRFATAMQTNIENVFNALEAQSGDIWLELGGPNVARLSYKAGQLSLHKYGTADGIPEGWAEVFVIDHELRINSSGRTSRFNPTSNRFETDPEVFRYLPQLQNTIGGRPTRDAKGRIWIPDTDVVRIVEDRGGGRSIENLPADLKPNNFVCEKDGVVWLIERLRFVRYDPSVAPPDPITLTAIISRIDLPFSNRSFVNPQQGIPSLNYDDNTLVIHYAASSVPFGERITFEFKLDDLQGEWTPTGIIGSTVLNRLEPGSHTLRVRPRSVSAIGEETTLSFEILPPWYKTSSAYAAYAFSGLVLLGLCIFGPLLYERRQKRRLATLVNERTHELSASEERYKYLNAELENRVTQRTHELDQAAKRLSTANQELESFSYSVSHDLRAPLRNITGFIELIQRKMENSQFEECKHPMSVVHSEAKRMASLIEDLLVFSRLSRSEMKSEAVSLESIVDECKAELAHELEQRQIEWQLDAIPLVQGDRALIRQVMANLLGNAVKFTKGRTLARIRIHADPFPDPDGFLFIHVTDNGAGFNPKYIDKLFGVFQRLHSAKEFEGTGIGLANVKRIITRHGGQVRAEGKPDAGATISFSLPVAAHTRSKEQGTA